MNSQGAFIGGRAHKLCATTCALAVLVFCCFIVLGAVDQDVAGAAVVGVLVAAPFIDVAVLASNWASERARLFACLTWGVMAVVLLGGTLSMLSMGKSDADLVLTYGTGLLAFPLGLIAGPITGQFSMPAGPLQTTVLWAIAIGAGCLQWLILIPTLVRARAADRGASVRS